MKAQKFYFSYKQAVVNFTLEEDAAEYACRRFIQHYDEVENYCKSHPGFRDALEPLAVPDDCPLIVNTMAAAASRAGTGPMAAVAGTVAQFTGIDLLAKFGPRPIVIENGGDVVIYSLEETSLQLFSAHPDYANLTLTIPPRNNWVAVCSSSGKVGHSLSFGYADIATVIADDGPLADAFATKLANLARGPRDQVKAAMQKLADNPFVKSAILIYENEIYLAGEAPRLSFNKES